MEGEPRSGSGLEPPRTPGYGCGPTLDPAPAIKPLPPKSTPQLLPPQLWPPPARNNSSSVAAAAADVEAYACSAIKACCRAA
jgi:hypothetical protein